VYKYKLSRQTGNKNASYRGKRFWIHHIPTSCLATLLIFLHIEHTMYMLIFRRIFLSNYWWQKSDIWSQASYRKAILWEAFLFPVCRLSLYLYTCRNMMDPKTLPTILCNYIKLVTKYQISAINSCWEKCDEKWAYMFNVYNWYFVTSLI
jgi:hypothetical protein